MIFPSFLRCLFVALSVSVAASLGAASGKRIPVVLVTDIGDDIDDTWALAHLLRSPELELKLVVTDYGHARYRASLIAKFLEAAGRTDVAVGLGVETEATELEKRNQAPWIKGYDLAAYPGKTYKDGVGAIVDLANSSADPVTVIAIGPAPTVAAVVTRDPAFAKKCRLVGMFGSFDLGYEGKAGAAAEWNVRADVAAARKVLGAPWREAVITPLDTCGLVQLDGENYASVWRAGPTDPVVRAILENYCIWSPRCPWMTWGAFVTKSTTLFDDVAVYLAYSEAGLELENLRFHVSDEGVTVRDPQGPCQARVALRWTDKASFQRHLAHRLRTPVAQ